MFVCLFFLCFKHFFEASILKMLAKFQVNLISSCSFMSLGSDEDSVCWYAWEVSVKLCVNEWLLGQRKHLAETDEGRTFTLLTVKVSTFFLFDWQVCGPRPFSETLRRNQCSHFWPNSATRFTALTLKVHVWTDHLIRISSLTCYLYYVRAASFWNNFDRT